VTPHLKFSVSGELVQVVSTLVDVTERKRADEALRESQAKFRDYAESASDWFWEIGPDYKFTMLTENAFGSNADRIGTTCWDRALDLETEPEKCRHQTGEGSVGPAHGDAADRTVGGLFEMRKVQPPR
jgi:PAS domain-containing protein